MRRSILWLAAAWLLCVAGAAAASGPLAISLAADPANTPAPHMGDRLCFESVIRGTGSAPAQGVVAWISLIRVDSGHEQPVDLEDWSAHKAVTRASLAPGAEIKVQWPMRLIQAGDYRVVISAVERDTSHVITSPFIDFHVERKAMVESRRILPVALGMPLLLAGVMLLRRPRRSSRGDGRTSA